MDAATNGKAKSPAKTKVVAWRSMSADDIESLVRVANKIHPDLPESDQVFAERVTLFPAGCLALAEDDGGGDELCGYVISHPIRRRQPPALDSLLGEIASDADQYYVHDLAILPEQCMEKLFATAKRYTTTSVVSVYGTAPFWGRFGFVVEEIDEDLKMKVLDYGDDATYLERMNEESTSS
ncbi:MAG: hypothetical protein LQ348_000703 [Seirophora lacunosa]|nr:MAG: hypothetical protein LQ348_000703 [Seirophora lacunosa]